MKILVISDIHMKSWILDRADQLIKQEEPDLVVQLGDLPDDWGYQTNLEAYRNFYNYAERFRDAHPEVLWCYGNHDLSYLWDRPESGMAMYGVVREYVTRRIEEFYAGIPKKNAAILHYVDGILFSHAGLTTEFVNRYDVGDGSVDEVVNAVNSMNGGKLWQDCSPLWTRLQGDNRPGRMYKDKEILQIVGHTPVVRITQEQNLISCDNFSTFLDGTPIGTQSFLMIDSETRKWCGIL